MLTDEEFARLLRERLRNKDKEERHIDADVLVADALEQAGFKKTADTYRAAMDDFWFA
jgi:HEAT repeat protein